MSHKDNENNIENGFIFMEKGKSMFHVVSCKIKCDKG